MFYGNTCYIFLIEVLIYYNILMETGTVLQIIAMLDQRAEYYRELASEHHDDMMHGKYLAYSEFSEHLQSYIEAQLNAAEIQTGE